MTDSNRDRTQDTPVTKQKWRIIIFTPGVPNWHLLDFVTKVWGVQITDYEILSDEAGDILCIGTQMQDVLRRV